MKKKVLATQKMVNKVDKKDKVIHLLNIAAQSAKDIKLTPSRSFAPSV